MLIFFSGIEEQETQHTQKGFIRSMTMHWPGYGAQQKKRWYKVCWGSGFRGWGQVLLLLFPSQSCLSPPSSSSLSSWFHSRSHFSSSLTVLKNLSLSPISLLVLLPRFAPGYLLTLRSLPWRPHVLPSRMNSCFIDIFPFVCIIFNSFHQSLVVWGLPSWRSG